MPNHVKSIIKVIGKSEEISKMRAEIQSNEKDTEDKNAQIDFNKIIQTPEHIFQGNLGSAEAEKYWKSNCWYEWNIKNWGTKWNAYSTGSISASGFYFETAWAAPFPIYEALSKKYPDLTFKIRYADEDRGRNLGKISFKNGALISEDSMEGDYTKRDKAFARRVWNHG